MKSGQKTNKVTLNAITVDVEESFHATNFAPFVPREKWDDMPTRVVEATEKVLRLFEKHNVKGTFFVLGYVAGRHPELIRRIVADGHELASHGSEHQLVYQLTPAQFLKDISDSKKILEDTAGVKVLGYRAPNFSIVDSCDWAYDKILEAGFIYDASLYPVRHPRYSNPHKPRFPQMITRESGKLFIFPAATAAVNLAGAEMRLPVAGGAYWRMLPKRYCRWGLTRINRKDKFPFVCYVHPWEFDAAQSKIQGPSKMTLFRHYGGIDTFQSTVDYYLQHFKFSTVRELAKSFYGFDIEEAFKI